MKKWQRVMQKAVCLLFAGSLMAGIGSALAEDIEASGGRRLYDGILQTQASPVSSSPGTSPGIGVSPSPGTSPVIGVSPSPGTSPVIGVSPSPGTSPASSVSPSPSTSPASSVSPSPSTSPASSASPRPSPSSQTGEETAATSTPTPTSTLTPVPTVTPPPTQTPTPAPTIKVDVPSPTPTPVADTYIQIKAGYGTNLAAGKRLADVSLSMFEVRVNGTNAIVPSSYGTVSWKNGTPTAVPMANGSYSFTVEFTVGSPYRSQYSNCSATVTFAVAAATTAAQINTGVSKLPASGSALADEVPAIINGWAANARNQLSTTEKRKLTKTTIQHLGELFCQIHGQQDVISLYTGNAGSFSSKKRIPDDNFATGVQLAAGPNAGLYMTLTQLEPASSSVKAQFRIDPQGMNDMPILFKIALPSEVANGKNFYILDPDGKRLSVSVERGRAVFLATTLDGSFRLYSGSGSSSSSRDEDDDDDDYEVSEFWQDVIDEIYDANNGSRIRVDIGSKTKVPADVLRELRGQDVTLTLRRKNGNNISIYGKDVPKVPESRDYYTVSTLYNQYNRPDPTPRPTKRPTPTPTRTPKPTATPAPTPRPSVIYVPKYIYTTAPTPTERPPEPKDEEDEDGILDPIIDSEEDKDREQVAEEDSSSEEESSSQEEQQVNAQTQTDNAFATFISLTIITLVAAAGVVTFAICRNMMKK